jgi:8-oxo-dGTP pyrophosphatase MutT (NUDIX family)
VKGETSLEVLLVTSRQTRRWIIPKGWPIKGLTPAKAAAREAYEEAGVRGRIAGRAIGYYTYEKRLDDRRGIVPCEVKVFPLAVKRQLDDWPEAAQRTVRWVSATRAASMVRDKGLRGLILELRTLKGPRRGA